MYMGENPGYCPSYKSAHEIILFLLPALEFCVFVCV